jgi:hypothetical protein
MSDKENPIGEIIRKVIAEEMATWPLPFFDLDGAKVARRGTVELTVRWEIPPESASRIEAACEAVMGPLLEKIRASRSA